MEKRCLHSNPTLSLRWLVFKFFFLSCLGFNLLFSLDIFYLFQIDGGINFFNQDKDKITSKYDLDDLENTIAPVVNIRTGAVWDRHWLTLVGYGFARREDYDYRLNYFTLNQKAYEQRDIHNVHAQFGYFFFPYQNGFNVSLGTSLGWALYRSTLTTIDNYSATSSSGLRQRNQSLVFELHQFHFTPVIKLYRNLRRGLGLGGDIYLGMQYSMLFPSKVNFPEIILGFDASIDFSYKTDRKKNAFISQEDEEIDKKVEEEVDNIEKAKSEMEEEKEEEEGVQE